MVQEGIRTDHSDNWHSFVAQICFVAAETGSEQISRIGSGQNIYLVIMPIVNAVEAQVPTISPEIMAILQLLPQSD